MAALMANEMVANGPVPPTKRVAAKAAWFSSNKFSMVFPHPIP
jgi:hypothetical protein